eukprot:2702674-Lingulodinium_polyedra.AAC.1
MPGGLVGQGPCQPEACCCRSEETGPTTSRSLDFPLGAALASAGFAKLAASSAPTGISPTKPSGGLAGSPPSNSGHNKGLRVCLSAAFSSFQESASR